MKYTHHNRRRVPIFLIAGFLCVLALVFFMLFSPGEQPSLKMPITPFAPSLHKTPNGYYVQGDKIYDAQGRPHIFKGVSRPSLEWNAEGEHLSLDDYKQMKSWGFNLVRIPLNQRFWLRDEDGYKARVAENVRWIKSLGMDVMLDLHWSDRNDDTRDAAQQRMADDNSLTFWTQVSGIYKDDGRVMFELYNEPHDVSWNTWQYGGSTGDGFDAVGMQDMYDAIRDAGADNIVIINGLNWAFDLSQVRDYQIDGYNIIYGIHIYDQPGKRAEGDWNKSLAQVLHTHPVVVSEFGTFDCQAGFYDKVLSYTSRNNISWIAWAWYPGGCGFPALINNWDGAPNVVGEMVKSHLNTR